MMLEVVFQSVAEVQTELTIFVIAICVHHLLFGKYGFSAPLQKKASPSGHATLKIVADDTLHQPRSMQSAGHLTQLARQSLRLGAGRQQLTEQLLESLKDTPDEASPALAEMLRSLGKAGTDIVANTRAAKMISEISFKHNRPDVLGQLLSTGPPGPGHVALLKSFGSEGRLAEAKFVFEVCSEKSTLLYNALLDVCIECKDLKEAEKVMEQAVAQGMADAVTYNTMIKKHLQRGDLNVVRATVETMRTAGGSLAPNCVTFNEYIDAAMRTNTKLAWDLIEEMKVCGLTPNSVTCSIVLKGVQRTSAAEDVERAVQLAEEVEVDEVLVSSLFEACIRGGRADLLQRSLRRMKNVSINGAHTFGSMVRAYGFLGDVRGAWSTWKGMRLLGVIPTSTTIGCMVEALASNGDAESAHQLVRELAADEQTRSLLNSIIYGSVLKGFSHQKKFDHVWDVYQEMVDANIEMTLATYNALLDTCARSGDMARIGVLLQDMGRQNIEANLVTYGTVLKAYVQAGRLTQAFELFEEMKASKNMQPDEIIYNMLIDGCARCTLYDQGMKVLEEMQQKGIRPSVYTISVLVKLAARCKGPKQAAGLLNDISRKYNIRLNVHAYNNLANAWTQQGQMREAFETIERMLHDGVWPDVRTYTIMLRGCLSAGDAQGAAGLLRAAVGLGGVHPRIACFDPKKLQPRDGLPANLRTEVLEGLAGKCGDQRLAQQLLWDLRGPKASLQRA